MPVASIVIPAFNAADFIERALHSAINQSEQNIEVIVVDDASTDETVALVHKLMQSDRRIRLEQNQVNSGVSRTRNRALDLAQGDWIMVLDADDWITPDRVEVLCSLGTEKDADLVFDNLNLLKGEENTPIGSLLSATSREPAPLDGPDYVANDNPEELGSGVLKPTVRRAFLDQHHIRYRNDLNIGEDFLFAVECFAHGAAAYLEPTQHYNYRIHQGSLSRRQSTEQSDKIVHGSLAARQIAEALNQTDLLQALIKRHRAFEKNARYRTVINPILDHDFAKGVNNAYHDPTILPYLVRRMGIRLIRPKII